MKLIESYIQLLAAFSQNLKCQTVKITRIEIGKEWICTVRNVTYLLNKMEENGWIFRRKGKGRGNVTEITFLKSLSEMVQLFGQSNPKYEDIDRLVKLLQDKRLLTGTNIETLLSEIFGVKSGVSSNSNLQDYDYLTIPYFRKVGSLDPLNAERQTERHLVEQIFNTLVTYNEELKRLEPSIAHYWENDEGTGICTFYLRKSVYFHNGEALTSEDVKYTFDRLSQSSVSWMTRFIKSITCKGSHIIQIEFIGSVVNLINILTSPKCSIVPSVLSNRTDKEFMHLPIGTGPYKINNHDKNVLELKVHENYFQQRAYIDEVKMMFLPSIEKYYETDEEPHFYIPFTKIDKNALNKISERKDLSIKYLMWNMNKEGIKKNLPLRKKVESILHKVKMIKDLNYPRYKPRNSFINQTVDNRPEPKDLPPQMGSVTLMTYELTPNEEDIRWIQHECAKYGLRVNLVVVPYSSFIHRSNEADLVLSEYVAEKVEEVALMNLFFSQTSIAYCLLDQSEMEKANLMLEKIMKEKHSSKRIDLLQFHENRLRESSIILPIYSTYQRASYHKNLMGVGINSIGLVPFKDIFIRR